MDHNVLKEKIVLFVYGEIPENEKQILEEHLESCNECKNEFNTLLSFYSQSKNQFQVDDEFLSQARVELQNTILTNYDKESLFERLINQIKEFFTNNYSYAFASVSFLLIGFLAGYVLFQQNETSLNNMNTNKPGTSVDLISANDESVLSESMISNVRFIDSDASDGIIEFEFNAIKPMQIKGNIQDPAIQKLLSHSILNSDNDGIKLRTIGAVSSQSQTSFQDDGRIKDALITALKSDKNVGVRREALLTLEKYNYDEKVKDAFLYALENDENPGIRIAAIKMINNRSGNKNNFDNEVLKVLKNKSINDNNDFIRIKAKSLLEEVN